MYTRLLSKYFTVTAAFGLGRSIPQAINLQHEYIINRPVDALLVDKFAYCFCTAANSPVLWPYYCYKDVKAFELFVRDKRVDDYPGSGL